MRWTKSRSSRTSSRLSSLRATRRSPPRHQPPRRPCQACPTPRSQKSKASSSSPDWHCWAGEPATPDVFAHRVVVIKGSEPLRVELDERAARRVDKECASSVRRTARHHMHVAQDGGAGGARAKLGGAPVLRAARPKRSAAGLIRAEEARASGSRTDPEVPAVPDNDCCRQSHFARSCSLRRDRQQYMGIDGASQRRAILRYFSTAGSQ